MARRPVQKDHRQQASKAEPHDPGPLLGSLDGPPLMSGGGLAAPGRLAAGTLRTRACARTQPPVDALHARAPVTKGKAGAAEERRETRRNGRRRSCGPGSGPRTPALAASSQTALRPPPYLKLLVSREARELSELQLNARDLGHRAVRGPAGRVGGPGADVHVRVRDLGGRLERGQQPIPKVLLTTRHGEAGGFPSHGGLGSVPRRPPPDLVPLSGPGTSLASRGLGAPQPQNRPAPRGPGSTSPGWRRGQAATPAHPRTREGDSDDRERRNPRVTPGPQPGAPRPRNHRLLTRDARAPGHSRPSSGRGRPRTGGRRSEGHPGSGSCSQTGSRPRPSETVAS